MTNKSVDTLSEQLRVMLTMQDELNKQVFPDWHERNLAWHRAIYIEAGEFLEHLGTWKWWKKSNPDYAQANMELVDIWHFGISQLIDHRGMAQAQGHLEQALPPLLESNPPLSQEQRSALEVEQVHSAVDNMVAAAGARRFDLESFITLLGYSGMSFEDLYRSYVGKNILNRFRQDNGYKTGTYIKMWDGQEDNEYLNTVLLELPVDSALPDNVYKALHTRYSALAA